MKNDKCLKQDNDNSNSEEGSKFVYHVNYRNVKLCMGPQGEQRVSDDNQLSPVITESMMVQPNKRKKKITYYRSNRI